VTAKGRGADGHMLSGDTVCLLDSRVPTVCGSARRGSRLRSRRAGTRTKGRWLLAYGLWLRASADWRVLLCLMIGLGPWRTRKKRGPIVVKFTYRPSLSEFPGVRCLCKIYVGIIQNNVFVQDLCGYNTKFDITG